MLPSLREHRICAGEAVELFCVNIHPARHGRNGRRVGEGATGKNQSAQDGELDVQSSMKQGAASRRGRLLAAPAAFLRGRGRPIRGERAEHEVPESFSFSKPIDSGTFS